MVTEHEVKKYLKSHFYAEKKIQALLAEQQKLRADALGCGVNYENIGKTGSRDNGTEKKLMKLADEEEKIDCQIKALKAEQDKVRESISLLNDSDLESVLIYRYILYNSKDKTARLLNYASRSVAYKQSKAIKKLCTLLH